MHRNLDLGSNVGREPNSSSLRSPHHTCALQSIVGRLCNLDLRFTKERMRRFICSRRDVECHLQPLIFNSNTLMF